MSLCLLCQARERKTTVKAGRVCLACASRLAVDLAEILRLRDDATDWTPPPSNGGGAGVFESKPPLPVETLDPELELVALNLGDPSSRVTILEMVEMWERSIRYDRDLAPIGIVTGGGPMGTGYALARSVRFLGTQVAWISLSDTFDVVTFAEHIRAAVYVLGKYDVDRDSAGYAVPCPTLTEDGDCGYWLRYRDASKPVTCRRCKVTRDVDQLVAVALADSTKPVWVDPEAAARHYGVTERELRRLASRGRVERNRGRYLLSSITREIYA